MISKHLIINVSIFSSILIALYIGESIGPNKVGFWCSDESIRHDYLPQVIDFRFLLFTVFVVPLVLFAILHFDEFKYNSRNYFYGLSINILLTLYCKLIIGRPRPNFYSLCKPKWDNEQIKCLITDKQFITNYTCTNSKKWLTSNSNQSFFSGHSALGTYSALFIIFFLNDKLKIDGFIKAHLLFIIFMLGLLPGLTQYLNFWHFASDVFIGDLVGFLLAIFAYYGIRSFDHKQSLLHKASKVNN